MIVTLDAKRRLTIPTALAPVKPGDLFEAAFDAEEGVIVFRRLAKGKDWLAILEGCPVPMDDLPPRRHARPAAAIIGFEAEETRLDDRLENDERFLARIERSRRQILEGRTVRLEDLPD